MQIKELNDSRNLKFSETVKSQPVYVYEFVYEYVSLI